MLLAESAVAMNELAEPTLRDADLLSDGVLRLTALDNGHLDVKTHASSLQKISFS